MYNKKGFAIRLFIGFLVVFGILVYCMGVEFSRNIEVKIEKNVVILEKSQHIDYQSIEKMKSVFKIPLIAGSRG